MFNGGRGPTPPPPRVTSNPDQQAPAAPSRSAGAPPSHTDASSGGYNFSRASSYNASHPSSRSSSSPSSHTDASSGGYNFNRVKAYNQAQREVSALLSSIKPIDARLPTHVSGGLGFASLLNPLHMAKISLDALPNLGKDLITLPKNLLTGSELTAKMLFDAGSKFGANDPGGAINDVTDYGKNIVTSDPIYQALTTGSTKPITQHPLQAILDVLGGKGAIGRGAGAAARSGALGEHVAELASTARSPREIAPGIAPEIQQGSHDLINRLAQHIADQHPDLAKVTKRSATSVLNRRVDDFVPVMRAREQAALQDVTNQLKEAKPKGDTAHVVPHAVMGTAGAPHDFIAGLERRLSDLRAAEAAHHSGEAVLAPKSLKANVQSQHNLTGFLGHPDVQKAFESASDYVARQHAIEEAKAGLGLLVPKQAERRALQPYALTNIPGAKIVGPKAFPTIRSLEARESLKSIGQAKKELVDAEKAHIKLTNAHGDAERSVLTAERQLAAAQRQQHGAEQFVQGRYGLGTELKSARAQASGNAVLRRLVGSDNAASHLQDLKGALKQARADRKEIGLNRIAAAKETLKDAREQFATVHKPYAKERRGGLVIEDPNAPMIRSGNLKGQHLRLLTNDEIKAHMEDAGMPPTAYARLTAPSESAGRGFLGGALRRGGSRGKRFTGRGLESGAYTPGYGMLAKSQLADVRQIQRAQAHDDFVHEMAVRDETGNLRTFDDHQWQHFADQYAREHGIEMAPVYQHPQALSEEQVARIKQLQNQGKLDQASQEASKDSFVARTIVDEDAPRSGRVVLVPKTQIQRYAQHLGIEPVEKLGGAVKFHVGNTNALTTLNRQFRNTVLPFSTKWLTGNVTEAGLRAALKGAGSGDYMLAKHVIDRMRELGLNDQADRLERLATGGLHYGMQERINNEQVSRTGAEATNPVAHRAKQLSSAYGHTIQGIYSLNRHMESATEKAVLGTHMRRSLHQFSGSWAKAVVKQKQYIDKLAKGYADPRMAADAGRYVHDVLGQYDRFSPAMKQFVSSYAPFMPWYRNSLKFIYYTLPAKHPITTAVLNDTAIANEKEWAKSHDVPHDSFAGVTTGDLESALKVGPHDFLNLGRYTPAGAFTNGPLDYATNAILPQFSGIFNATRGLDPFGNQFQGPGGKVTDKSQWALFALNQLLGELAGPAQVTQRVLLQHGSTPYNTTTLWNTQLKPDTHHGPPGVLGGLNRVFNPFEPTHLKKNSTGTSSGYIPKAVGSPGGVGGKIPKAQGNVGLFAFGVPGEPPFVSGPQGGLWNRHASGPDRMPEQPMMSMTYRQFLQPATTGRLSLKNWQHLHGLHREPHYAAKLGHV